MKTSRSMKAQLMRFVLIYIFVIAALMAYNAADNARRMREGTKAFFENTVRQINRIVEKSVSNTAFFAYTLSRNDAVQAMLRSRADSGLVGYEIERQIDTYMSQNGPFLYLNMGIVNVVLLDADYAPFFATFYSGNDAAVYSYLQSNYALRTAARRGGICPINKEAASTYAPTFVYAIDVYDTQLNKDGNRRIGTIAILCSLNKYYRSISELGGMDSIKISYRIWDGRNTILAVGEPAADPLFSVAVPFMDTSWQIDSSVAMSPYVLDLLFADNRTTLVALVAALCAIPLFLCVFQAYLTRPISQLLRRINGLIPGQRLASGLFREINAISEYINQTLDQSDQMHMQLNTRLREIQELEVVRARTELAALQSQINPHFLYNTLECVRSIAIVNHIGSIEDIASAMAAMFRYATRGTETVRVRDEVEMIEEYLKIVRIRFSDRYASQIQIDEDIMDLPILKMILQPLVENAIFHGLEKRRRGKVRILGARDGGVLRFTVEDDGGGFDSGKLASIVEMLYLDEAPGSHDIGLLNINRKIRIFYGKEYGVRIRSEAPTTQVSVVFPV